MRPIDFEGANAFYNKPQSMTDDQCLPVSALQIFDDSNNHVIAIATVWQPSKEDIDAINLGRPIIVKTSGATLPPMLLFTTVEEGIGNF